MLSVQTSVRLLVVLCAIALLPACGGSSGGGGGGGTPTTPTIPTVAIAATGNGLLVVHPSLDNVWCCKLYTPISIRETAGGTADWHYARMSLWLNGVEVERAEIGADILSQPPDWTDIAANQDEDYAMVFGVNADDFDTVTITLGFSDKKDGRQFTADVPFGSFDGVDVSLIPLTRKTGVHRL